MPRSQLTSTKKEARHAPKGCRRRLGLPKLNGDSDVLGLAAGSLVTQHNQRRASVRFGTAILLEMCCCKGACIVTGSTLVGKGKDPCEGSGNAVLLAF